MPRKFNRIPGYVTIANGETIKLNADGTAWESHKYPDTKADIGLSNVDNTSDSSKPVSTAQQTALDSKMNTVTLATVATTGSYNDLSNKPTIPSAQVPSDWSVSSGVTRILNKPTLKRQETYLGITNASGNYTVTYPIAYLSIPDVQPQLQSGTASQVVRITSSTTTGFTVQVTNRGSVTILGLEVLLASTTAVVSSPISVLVTER